MALGDLLQYAAVTFQLIEDPLNAFVIALVILLSGSVIGRIADRLLFKVLRQVSYEDRVARLLKTRRNYERATRRSIVYLIYILTVYLALAQLGLVGTLAAAVLVLFIFAAMTTVVLAAVEVMPALRIRAKLKRRGIGKGDVVRIADPSGTLTGRVAKLSLIEVQMQRGDGETIFYPLVALSTVPITKRRR